MWLVWTLAGLVALLALVGAAFLAMWISDLVHHRHGASRWLWDGLMLWFAGAVLAVLAVWLHANP